MKIFVKELKGKEIQVECDDETKIIDVKLSIEKQLSIPVFQQKLLHLGKILQDQNTLQSYNIKENSKLMLTKVAKQPLSKIIASNSCGYGKFYDEETANNLSKKFTENLKRKLLKEYSLDDIERLAQVFLQEKENQ